MRVKTPSLETLIASLSGGNQQKVILAKWMLLDPDILILDEPTRGIDVGAKQEIYRLIGELAEQGKVDHYGVFRAARVNRYVRSHLCHVARKDDWGISTR